MLEGKYWKRKLEAVTAEYKKWRMFYRNQVLGHSKDITDIVSITIQIKVNLFFLLLTKIF